MPALRRNAIRLGAVTQPRGAWSLRQRLLAWLLAPLVLWSLGSSGLAYLLALHFTTQAYDRSLHASILDIERQLTVVDSRPAIDLPPAAIQILEWNDEDRVYYRVATASGRHIAGEPEAARASARWQLATLATSTLSSPTGRCASRPP